MRFLAAIDLATDGHEWLADQALAFAKAYGKTVDLLYVGKSPGAEDALVALLERGAPALRGDAVLREGAPLDCIIEASKDYDALIMGSRAHGALERFVLGTMAARVIRSAACAVYVPRSPPDKARPEHPRMLVGIDMVGKNPEWMVARAAVWAQQVHGRLDAFFADPYGLPHIADASIRDAAMLQWRKQHEPARQKLQDMLEAAAPNNFGEAKVVDGEPESVLVEMSRDYDLVLLGTRQRLGIAGYVLGSVAEHVVQNSHCDVLTLPSNAVDGP